MAEIPELGRKEKVELRRVWRDEAKDFTPWLSEQGLDELGDALGLELELQSIEASVGSFALDMLCRELGENRTVIIENQLGKTDHDHLGKLLTYAGGHDANVIVWIAEDFRDEHRQALELLNQRTGKDTELFGVVIELWKIGDSHPAPHFKMIVTPNEWTSEIKASESELNLRYLEFFQKLIDSLRGLGFTNARKAQPFNFSSFSAGHAGLYYARLTKKEAKVEINISSKDRDWNKILFDKLIERRDHIESELSESLKWKRLDNQLSSKVEVSRQGGIDDLEKLEETRGWMIEKLMDFKRVFGPMLDELAVLR